MPEELKAQVTRVFESPLLLPTGGVEQRIRVDYMVGTHGPFSITLPAAEFSAARVKTEMEKTAGEIRTLAAGR